MSTASIPYPKTLPCDVSEESNGTELKVNCTERNLKYIPFGIPRNTTNLTLTINHIPDLNSTVFRDLVNLTEIDMRCNCVPVKIGPKDRICTKSVTIDEHAFASLKNLRALYLDGNQLNSIPQGLPSNLILLSLEVNNIFHISKGNLSGIRNVEMLYLSQNCYYRNPCNYSYYVEEGAFLELQNLTLLCLKSNNLSYIPHQLPTSLKELYLYNNNIEEVTDEDFKNLTNLEILDISGNCPRCYNAPFPCKPCPNDSPLKISKTAFKMLTKLKTLRMHSNSLTSVPSEWFANTRELRQLKPESIAPLKALPDLEVVDLGTNFIKMTNFSILMELKSFQIISLSDNKISSPSDGQDAVGYSGGELFQWSPMSAAAQTKEVREIHYFRYDEYARSCKYKSKELGHSYLSIILYTLMTSLILSFLALSISSHLFLWDVWYIYHFCRAKLKGYGRLYSQSSVYDAFVMYDKEDPAVTEWVMKEMCFHLEEHGDRPLTLCLEERDWIPGCPLIDNLSQSIHKSKRTMFILTSRYIKSGNFKTAFYMAHQRLMDEKNDVIVLIFLEKVPCNSKYLRLRKRLYKRSVLEWPTNPQAQPYFWFSLRSVLATESHKQYSNLFKETL
ncbi:Toll-like receptor 7 [Nibea albiflora]|uniref:Toll-like receptor 7 n=1 Tax=Nibea albiflora TaxID=240163 RepID=A0ACB7EEK5_NIBAL|nr:Toll-like receptor 7 [Nibea albiflora]